VFPGLGGRLLGRARVNDPGVLRAAAQAGVHLELALFERHAGEAAGQDPDVAAVVDGEGPQVDVAGGQLLADQHRGGGQRDRFLGHPAAWVGPDLGPERVQFLIGGARADDDACAAGPVDRLEHEVAHLAEYPVEHVRVFEAVRLHVLQDRFLA